VNWTGCVARTGPAVRHYFVPTQNEPNLDVTDTNFSLILLFGHCVVPSEMTPLALGFALKSYTGMHYAFPSALTTQVLYGYCTVRTL
jgi:hypothetical protein